jgi:hypothetical protein
MSTINLCLLASKWLHQRNQLDVCSAVGIAILKRKGMHCREYSA